MFLIKSNTKLTIEYKKKNIQLINIYTPNGNPVDTEKYDYKNICISGGVSLNCLLAGKIYDWFPEIESIYAAPIPYDAGLTLGSARYLWHHVLDNPRI